MISDIFSNLIFMKKSALCLVVLIAAMCLSGQNVSVLKTDTRRPVMQMPFIANGVIEDSGDSYYIFNAGYYPLSEKKMVDDYVYVMDKKTHAISEIHLQRLSYCTFLCMYEDQSDIIAIYEAWNRKSKTYSLIMNKIDKSQSAASWNPQEIFTVSVPTKNDVHVKYAISPDYSHVAFLIYALDNGRLVKSEVSVWGEHGEKQGEDPLETDFVNQTIQILDLLVDNGGMVYSAIISYDNRTADSRENETLHLWMMSDNTIRVLDETVDFGYVTSAKLKLLRNGNMAIGGYFTERLSKPEAGAYMAIVDMKNEDISTNTMPFPSDYYGNSDVYDLHDTCYSTEIQYVEEFSDGSLLLLGEMRAKRLVLFTDGGSYYRHYARHIPVFYTDVQGTLNDFALIKKNQYANNGDVEPSYWLRGQGYSYFAKMFQDKVYLFFSDALDNYKGKSDVPAKSTYRLELASAFCAIVPHQPVYVDALLMGLQSKHDMRIPLFIESDGVIGLAISDRYKGEIIKVAHPF